MRPLHLADIETAARALVLIRAEDRAAVMQDMIAKAALADRYRIAHGRPHPLFGTGTLMSCALRRAVAPRPAALGPDVLHALAIATRELRGFYMHQFQ
ncbi:hypothetical protein AN191_06725 [Loktanella sp. 5RATIMAR09]|uniref:DUF7742 family protein n=1 Tax=Loktanella sp. 5RATIMAR09 TaxID=1225655 RepID=UPI0006EB37F6|nr:hypothetical protein [Loktanella sp. 5RATIMAR09]KQI72697.1 hypothetical protein AN191_06725 [Loktanella sp. 5RATIMAR09]